MYKEVDVSICCTRLEMALLNVCEVLYSYEDSARAVRGAGASERRSPTLASPCANASGCASLGTTGTATAEKGNVSRTLGCLCY